MVEFTILTNPFFTQGVLPFLLVFVLVYAILARIKILGENEKTNVILAVVIGLIFVTSSFAMHITTQFMAVLAVSAVIILTFMLLLGFVYGEDFKMNKGLRITFGVMIGLTLIITVLVVTGYWSYVKTAFTGGTGSSVAMNFVFIGILIAAIATVLGRKRGN